MKANYSVKHPVEDARLHTANTGILLIPPSILRILVRYPARIHLDQEGVSGGTRSFYVLSLSREEPSANENLNRKSLRHPGCPSGIQAINIPWKAILPDQKLPLMWPDFYLASFN